MSISAKVTDTMSGKLRAMQKRIPEVMRTALYRRAEFVMTKSKTSYVPIDLGTLKNSGHVEAPVQSGAMVSVDLVFGGPAAPYAKAIHDHPSSSSPPSWRGVNVQFHPSGRGPGYLMTPLMEQVKTLPADLVRDGLNFERMMGR